MHLEIRTHGKEHGSERFIVHGTEQQIDGSSKVFDSNIMQAFLEVGNSRIVERDYSV
jgi:hypothetical protein